MSVFSVVESSDISVSSSTLALSLFALGSSSADLAAFFDLRSPRGRLGDLGVSDIFAGDACLWRWFPHQTAVASGIDASSRVCAERTSTGQVQSRIHDTPVRCVYCKLAWRKTPPLFEFLGLRSSPCKVPRLTSYRGHWRCNGEDCV